MIIKYIIYLICFHLFFQATKVPQKNNYQLRIIISEE